MSIEPNEPQHVNIPSIIVNGGLERGKVDVPGPDHKAETVVKPNAFWRTILQVGPFAALSLLLILPQVLEEILTAYGEQLPPEVYAVLVSVTAAITVIAGIAAKVMANPAVQAWIAKYAPFFRATK